MKANNMAEIKEKATFSHKSVMGMTIRFCDEQGWERISRRHYRGKFPLEPDLLYVCMAPFHFIAFEVKPSYASTAELINGIGQCTSYLASKYFRPMKSYLVIHTKQYLYNGELFELPKQLEWLGIVTYDSDSIKIAKEAHSVGTPAKRTA